MEEKPTDPRSDTRLVRVIPAKAGDRTTSSSCTAPRPTTPTSTSRTQEPTGAFSSASLSSRRKVGNTALQNAQFALGRREWRWREFSWTELFRQAAAYAFPCCWRLRDHLRAPKARSDSFASRAVRTVFWLLRVVLKTGMQGWGKLRTRTKALWRTAKRLRFFFGQNKNDEKEEEESSSAEEDPAAARWETSSS